MEEITEELRTLKDSSFRPKDWKRKIAKRTKFRESYIQQVFYGKRNNSDIALAIIKLFTDEKIKLKNELDRVKNL
jgi:hypothetical protein